MDKSFSELGRRERQIMDILVRRQRATAADVLADLPDPPSYSSVRSMLRLLEDKGYVTHEWEGPRHVFLPAGDPVRLRTDALRHLVTTFFNDSTESAVVALLGDGGKSLSREQLDRLATLIEKAKKKGARS
ncbi:MAG TPA: BlaI/MecI/CopY family transcriptional regulator [Gemmatimonadaceae bacterium]|nr:BlaI/MecI/CopY family transcriptional regulator [Gemmatimonadaceae bacterium]